MERVRGLLAQMPLFESFSDAHLRALIEQSRLETFAPQETIIRFGQPGRFLGVIVEGLVEVVIENGNGGRERLNVLSAGEFVGEMSLLTGEPTSADVIAMQRTTVLLIPQEQFTVFLAADRNALQVMAQVVTERLRQRLGDESAQARLEDAWHSTPDPYGLQLTTVAQCKILTLGCRSTRLEVGYFDTALPDNDRAGVVEGIGSTHARLTWSRGEDREIEAIDLGSVQDHPQAIELVLAGLTDPTGGLLAQLDELTAIGHKVPYGGETHGSVAVIDEQVMQHIAQPPSFASALNRLSLAAIRTAARLAPQVPQVAVFDTAFHQTVPPQAYLYALPYRLYDKGYVRRYGFQGIAHHYVALQAAATLKRNYRDLKIVTCHLGESVSLCAIDHGRSVDTSMGLTPLGGLMASTQSGDLDPSVILHLLRDEQWTVEQVEEMLNRESGLKGLSGTSGEFGPLEQAAREGDRRAILAMHAFCYRIRKHLGGYIAAMGGADAIVFTGRIGVDNAWVRSLSCQGLGYMGIEIDEVLNTALAVLPGATVEISSANSRAKILVIPTDEGRMIARETVRALGAYAVDQSTQRQAKAIPLEVSAHHVHLAPQHVDALFGLGAKLTVRADLSQPGQYACQ